MKIWTQDRSHLWKKAFDPDFACRYILYFFKIKTAVPQVISPTRLKALKKSYPLLYFIFLRDNINCH